MGLDDESVSKKHVIKKNDSFGSSTGGYKTNPCPSIVAYAVIRTHALF
jgi:hypothetical protein